MDKNYLIHLLEKYDSIYKEEIEFKKQTLNFIKQYDTCFERSLECVHITASCWLLNKDSSKALLIHHTKLDKWFQLGGHADGEMNVLNVGIKEAQEESGIKDIVAVFEDIFDIDIHLIPANKHNKEHLHYDIRFLLKVNSDEEIIKNNESKELRWISKNISDLPTDNPSVVRMFNKWIHLNLK